MLKFSIFVWQADKNDKNKCYTYITLIVGVGKFKTKHIIQMFD